MPGRQLNANRPWSKLDLPNGDCIPMERPCPECGGTKASEYAPPCEVCRDVGRIPTSAGMNILALVATHSTVTIEA